MMDDVPFVVPLPPAPLLEMPAGHYGISYDINKRATEDDLPHGWHSYRCEYFISVLNKVLNHH